ncbi:DUF1292 domain-containing protein [Lacicoccus qingdaonensis]|uniref:UPF0473 protein SAMN05216216_13218 n=1 Tax=Lacicoccus qingdaonensis TaxID=576118 RepID=A0A1G9ICW2_9BACL|nr:DUF1292 domain-containing protein [Salinicoccus qingdaonensis]SDL22946.1 Uncharacterized protein YrzB, UPF0473 family [Salinicoccus qingdaonensis]
MSHEMSFNHEEELLTLFDEEENEVLYRKMLEFHHPGFNKDYIILAEEGNFNDDDEEIELIPMINVPDENGDGGKFLPVETDEEWDMIEEIVNTQMDVPEE